MIISKPNLLSKLFSASLESRLYRPTTLCLANLLMIRTSKAILLDGMGRSWESMKEKKLVKNLVSFYKIQLVNKYIYMTYLYVT